MNNVRIINGIEIEFVCNKCSPKHIDYTYLECILHQVRVHGTDYNSTEK